MNLTWFPIITAARQSAGAVHLAALHFRIGIKSMHSLFFDFGGKSRKKKLPTNFFFTSID